MKRAICLFVILFASQSMALEKVVGRLYLNKFMGHLHKNPTKLSSSLTTLQCSHGLKVMESDAISAPVGWVYVQAGDDKGFIESRFLSATRPECFQDKYPRFYSELNLDLTDMYHWGRLFDHFDTGKSRVK